MHDYEGSNDTVRLHEDHVIITHITNPDGGTPIWSLYMLDESSPKVFPSYDHASREAVELTRFMKGCGYVVETYIVQGTGKNCAFVATE